MLRSYCLPLCQPWQTAQGAFTQRRGWIIQLHDSHGHAGLGDCAPLPQAGTESWQQAERQLTPMVKRLKGGQPESLLAELDSLESTPAARCGIEMALLDLLAREKNISVAHKLNPQAAEFVIVNQSAGTLAMLLASPPERTSGVIKLKVGLAAVEDELAQLRRLVRDYPDARFRLDANRAWSQLEAEQFICGCQAQVAGSIESIEEPLQIPEWDKLAELQAQATFPLALDESLTELDWPSVLARQPVRRVILKPMREGGIAVAARLATQAQSVGLECVVTTSVESAVGVWATLQLAAAVNVDQPLAHGLATSSWLQRDLAPAPVLREGRIYLPKRVGFGLDPDQISIV